MNISSKTISSAQAKSLLKKANVNRKRGKTSMFEPLLSKLTSLAIGSVLTVGDLKKHQVPNMKLYIRLNLTDVAPYIKFVTTNENDVLTVYMFRTEEKQPIRVRKPKVAKVVATKTTAKVVATKTTAKASK